ncbi:hypothetical protein [Kingella sp. (in: b-proteobacteria)]|uniref:hypothetical protein n=1 Tax=Kingella sp. (in: b-proteobacteria) TaxID=2020713 RepID=UPI0026DD1627|nr:hypothetical protein [Kingella sp. (in: b-proteobacteria)]MDO4657248.1 hypothetical protein [Kingella sp. (in: b-proteobacteria)]
MGWGKRTRQPENDFSVFRLPIACRNGMEFARAMASAYIVNRQSFPSTPAN